MPDRDPRPPVEPGLLPESAPCPFCEGRETELVNPFGGQLSVAQYWCRRCRTGFEYLKWEEHGEA
ncbi:MAG TPA: hypothetical protein VHG51_12610 [Longimicrobiaceae bacterium]|nr:hypothetical protein [Longimicrobiaceae bacterium]